MKIILLPIVKLLNKMFSHLNSWLEKRITASNKPSRHKMVTIMNWDLERDGIEALNLPSQDDNCTARDIFGNIVRDSEKEVVVPLETMKEAFKKAIKEIEQESYNKEFKFTIDGAEMFNLSKKVVDK